MTKQKTYIGRRAFIKTSILSGGGMMVAFSWLASCNLTTDQVKTLPKEWFKINGFLIKPKTIHQLCRKAEPVGDSVFNYICI